MLCNSKGLPLKFIVTAGQASDSPQSIPLLADKKASYVLADKGYDSDEILHYIEHTTKAIPVIPPRSNRIIQRSYERTLYKERNCIERLFNKLKNFRKLATRYEKIKTNFESLIYLACSMIWIN